MEAAANRRGGLTARRARATWQTYRQNVTDRAAELTGKASCSTLASIDIAGKQAQAAVMIVAEMRIRAKQATAPLAAASCNASIALMTPG